MQWWHCIKCLINITWAMLTLSFLTFIRHFILKIQQMANAINLVGDHKIKLAPCWFSSTSCSLIQPKRMWVPRNWKVKQNIMQGTAILTYEWGGRCRFELFFQTLKLNHLCTRIYLMWPNCCLEKLARFQLLWLSRLRITLLGQSSGIKDVNSRKYL